MPQNEYNISQADTTTIDCDHEHSSHSKIQIPPATTIYVFFRIAMMSVAMKSDILTRIITLNPTPKTLNLPPETLLSIFSAP